MLVVMYQFFAVCHQPFTERFVLPYLFQDKFAVCEFPQTSFDKIFQLWVFEIGAKIGDDAGRISICVYL